jgi:dUTP pyrophosphatase
MTPTHKTTGSAGADLVCAKTITLQPNETALVSTGAYVPSGLPKGVALLLMARSSIAFKKRLLLSNGVGLIDSDYTDEIKCMYTNLNGEPVTLERGERIAQLMPVQFTYGVFPVEDYERKGGFGSTGN